MKNHKFQQIRVRVSDFGESVRINAQTDKQYAKIRGIYVSLPDELLLSGALLGLRVNNQEVFEDAHEIKLITAVTKLLQIRSFSSLRSTWKLVDQRLKASSQMEALRPCLKVLQSLN